MKWTILFVALPLAVSAQIADEIKELQVKHPEGTITIRDGQLYGGETPAFKATLHNGTSRSWSAPVFEITYIGNGQKQSFRANGMCEWPKGKTCYVRKDLEFLPFPVEEIKIVMVGGVKSMSPEERAESDRQYRERQETERKLRTARESKEAIEAARVRAGCLLIYKSTINKRIGDLTVKETQQVKACELLGMYPPE